MQSDAVMSVAVALSEMTNTFPAVLTVLMLWIYLRKNTMGFEGLTRLRAGKIMPDDISGSTQRVMARLERQRSKNQQILDQLEEIERKSMTPQEQSAFVRMVQGVRKPEPEPEFDIFWGNCELCTEHDQLRPREVEDQELLLCNTCRHDLRDLEERVEYDSGYGAHSFPR